jgi:uncharacterized protein (TIGR02118 family)
MIKFIVVGYRRSELTPEQFRRYFREMHGPLAAAIPGVRRYIQELRTTRRAPASALGRRGGILVR